MCRKRCFSLRKLDLRGQKYGKLTVIEAAENVKGLTAWRCLCDCGNECIAMTKQLRNGKKSSCGCLQHTSPEVKIGNKYNQLTVISEIIDKPHYYLCQCECGKYTEVNEYNLKTDKVKSCGCLRNRPSLHRLELTGQKFGKLTALYLNEEKTRGSNRTYWHCRCDCGAEVDRTLDNLTQPNSIPSCGCLRSIGESNIQDVLIANNIQFEREKTFDNLISDKGYKYRYDFYLPEYNCLIEFDGEQHFGYKGNGWNTKEHFEETQEHDRLKNEYALSHNILLVRIPYWERDNITLDMIIGDQYLVKSEV